MPTPGDPPADDSGPAESPLSGRRPKDSRAPKPKRNVNPKGDKLLRVERRATTVAAEGEPVMIPSLAAPAWEFVHPRCARRRADDMEEVEAMIEAGEKDIAREELVWLLSECPDFLSAHLQLGLLALEEDDPKLARGHFGRAVEIGFRALEAAGNPRPLPYSLPDNRAFFESAKGLVHALLETGKKGMAGDTARKVAAVDPADPLGLVRLASSASGGSHG
jgi:hypothetical protein